MIQYSCDRCKVVLPGRPTDYTDFAKGPDIYGKMSKGVGIPFPEKHEKAFGFFWAQLCEKCITSLADWIKVN